MNHRHVICLVVDGLRASALGTYGNTSYPTPQLDALSSRSLVADWLWAETPHLEGFYRSTWQGAHALRPDVTDQQELVLDKLQQAGVRQWLVTDEPLLTAEAGRLPFDDALLFENEAEQAAEQIEDTTLGRFFSEAVERLHQWREDVSDTSSMTWLHCRGLHGPWDAPITLREDLLDDEDPPVEDFIQPPSSLVDVDDPDLLLAYRVAYAAQIKVLDACVGAFVEAIEEEFSGSETLVMLVGSRGFALGEHGSIGTDCTELYSERLHLPWLLYPCGNTTPLPRLATLSQPTDLGATLLDWLRPDETATETDGISCVPQLDSGVCQQRQVVVAVGSDNERAIRTPAWVLRQCHFGTTEEPTVELFTKPDDRWESNDVADRCPEVVEQLREELANYEEKALRKDALPLVPRGDELILPSR